MEAHQLEEIGAQKLYEKDRELQEDALDTISDGNGEFKYVEWAKLGKDYKQYWRDLYRAVAGEVGKLFRDEFNQDMVEVKDATVKTTREIKADRATLKQQLLKTQVELDLLKSQFEEIARGQAILNYISHLRKHNLTVVNQVEIENIMDRSIENEAFKKWLLKAKD